MLIEQVNLMVEGHIYSDNIECLEKVIKTKRLEKALDIKISQEIYESLRGVILGK